MFGVEGYTALDLHPQKGAERYTLKGFYTTEEKARKIVLDQHALGHIAEIFPFTMPDGSDHFGVGVQHSVQRRTRSGIPHRYSSDWQYVRIVLTEWRTVMRKSPDAVRWYKELEVDKIHESGQSIQWGGQVIDVAANLLSTPIVRHSLPNGNHRTNLRVVRLYLLSEGVPWPYWNLEGGGIKRFYQSANRFIVRSKYLLQLIRHTAMVKLAVDHGVDALLLGPTRCVPIQVDDLGRSRRELEALHQQASAAFIESLTSGKHAASLRELPASGRKTFTDRVVRRPA